MKTKQLLLKLAKRFPKSIAKKHHDYVGLMWGKLKPDTHKILLCLDFDDEVLEIARKEKPDLILTHHPFLFGTKAKVLKYDPYRKALCEQIDQEGLTVYSMHTNFDEGRGGMNDALARALELKNVQPLPLEPMARYGTLKEPMEIHDFARYAKEKLHVDYGYLLPYGKKTIQSVAILGGGGARYFPLAQKENIDIYISGDAMHHVRRSVVNQRYNYLDFPHEIERIFMPTMKELLLEMDPTLEILIVDHEKLPEII